MTNTESTDTTRKLDLMAGLSPVKDRTVLDLFQHFNGVVSLCLEIETEGDSIPAHIQQRAKLIRMGIMEIKSEVDSEVFDRIQDYKNEIQRMQIRLRDNELAAAQ